MKRCRHHVTPPLPLPLVPGQAAASLGLARVGPLITVRLGALLRELGCSLGLLAFTCDVRVVGRMAAVGENDTVVHFCAALQAGCTSNQLAAASCNALQATSL